MLYQSDYWLACSYGQKIETMRNFLDTDDGIITLLVIDKNMTTNTKDILEYLNEEDELPCAVELICSSGVIVYNPHIQTTNKMKSVYVRSNIDEDAIIIMKTLYPILAIFV